MRQPYRTALFASLILVICAGVLWAAYDWFQGRYLRAFSEHTAVFSGDLLTLPADLAGPGPIRLVHFWDPACPCNVGNQQHLGELIEQYAPQGVEFYALQKPGSHGQLPDNLRSMKTLTALPGAEQVPASPAVGIWDGHAHRFGLGVGGQDRNNGIVRTGALLQGEIAILQL